jgi:hypothetical protein
VESRRADQVVIVLRCAQCQYEWSAERLTPLFGDSRDTATPPEEPA